MRKFVIKDHTLYGPGDTMISITQANYPILIDLLNKHLNVFDQAKDFVKAFNSNTLQKDSVSKLEAAVAAADWSIEEEEIKDE